MNLILLCYGWFISENSGFMGEFSSFMALTVVYLAKITKFASKNEQYEQI